jgi:hypothetical protein
MQLWVAGARGPVPEHGSDQPFGRKHDRPAVPTSHRSCVPFEVAQRLGCGMVVPASHHVLDTVIAEAEQHADALGSRERQVEGGDVRTRSQSERCSGGRIEAGEQSSQVIRLHGIAEPETRRARSGPAARRLAGIRVVRRRSVERRPGRVEALMLDLEKVVLLARGQLGDREHTW